MKILDDIHETFGKSTRPWPAPIISKGPSATRSQLRILSCLIVLAVRTYAPLHSETFPYTEFGTRADELIDDGSDRGVGGFNRDGSPKNRCVQKKSVNAAFNKLQTDAGGGGKPKTDPLELKVFRLRYDSDVCRGWDSTGGEAWTCVGVGRRNNLVKLVLPACPPGLELAVDSGSIAYIHINGGAVPVAVDGVETTFDIDGVAATPLEGGKIVLRYVNCGAVVETLHVDVLPQRIIKFALFYASDFGVPFSKLPARLPQPAEIAGELNATFGPQANIEFVSQGSVTINMCRPCFATDGNFYTYGLYCGSIPAWEYLSIRYGQDRIHIAHLYQIYIVKNVVDVSPAVAVTSTEARQITIANANVSNRVFSHEAGRALGLPTQKGGTDFDHGPWPLEFHNPAQTPIHQGLMNDNQGIQERWLRRADWKEANTNAGEDPFQ